MAFSTRYIGNYQAELRLDLKDGSTLWSNYELDRSVQRAVDDLSRSYPLEAVYEHTISYTITGEASTAPAAGTYKALAYKPIRPKSETITNAAGTTTYTRGTDYTIDYMNGKYTIISTGSISENDSLLVSYTKSRLGIDLSAIISNLVRVVRVEYPADQVPQQFVSYNIWNDFMYIGSQKPGESQKQLNDGEHVVIYYDKPHTAPLASTVPSYPALLDEVICIGAGAYALLVKALQYEHQSVTDLASSRTALGNLSGIHTAVGTALGKLTAIHTLVDAAFDKVTTYIADADTALDAFISAIAAAPTALAKVDTYLAGASESTKAQLALITTFAAGLRTAALTAVDAANTYLDEVDTTDLQGAEAVWADEVKHILTEAGIPNAEDFLESGDDSIDISSILTKVETALDKIATEVAAGKSYLGTGDSLINKVNVGENVPGLYREYASVQADGVAAGYRWEAAERVNKARVQQQQAEEYRKYAEVTLEMAKLWESKRRDFLSGATTRINAALGFLGEADSRLNNLRSYIEQANGYSTIANGFVAEANGRIAVARSFIEEATQRLVMSRGYAEEANGRMAEIDRYLSEVGARLAELDDYMEEADRYISLANSDRELSDRFRTEGLERRNEFWSILKDKSEYRKRTSTTAVRQPA
ncbi:hypothetical protein LCGC14_0527230 [marine sediment metagenome]|uniref:Uncharacterized protein n=1 Tax=marine sediment metagenome TaxID=412755 RepID=A0A0F9S1G3_9ZZZZ